MNFESFGYAILAILVVLIFLVVLTWLLQKGFNTREWRLTNLYQGGEKIRDHERRYGSNTFLLTLFFLILHVLGFFIATMFVLQSNDILNLTTLVFLLILVYIAIIVKKVQGSIIK